MKTGNSLDLCIATKDTVGLLVGLEKQGQDEVTQVI